ncbi:hypothetical protein LPJ66_011995, partial [Kickxella alabastrina]
PGARVCARIGGGYVGGKGGGCWERGAEKRPGGGKAEELGWRRGEGGNRCYFGADPV